MVLPTYTDLQMDLVPYREQILALGVPDRRLAVLPSQFEELLSDDQIFGIDQPEGLTGDEVERLRELVADLTASCQELARYDIPESLDHQDLNDGNIFVRDRHPVFFDWGDAGITHPFFSLRTVVVSVELTLDLEEGRRRWRHSGMRTSNRGPAESQGNIFYEHSSWPNECG